MKLQGDRIEKKILLRFPRERVWRAISEAKRFGAWMGLSDHGEFAPSTVFTAKMAPTKFSREFAKLQEPYDRLPVKMTIDCIQPPSLFSFRFHPFAVDPAADYSSEPMNLVVFELKEVPGGTSLTITESGFDRISPERRAMAYQVNDAEWALATQALENYLTEEGDSLD
jgi:uncharacterized protein YndB with AHSA1/START domain